MKYWRPCLLISSPIYSIFSISTTRCLDLGLPLFWVTVITSDRVYLPLSMAFPFPKKTGHQDDLFKIKILIIKEMQSKTMWGYHCTPIRMTTIQKRGNTKCWQRCGQTRIPGHYWWECKMVQLLWKTAWWLLRKLHKVLPHDPAIPFLSIYQKELWESKTDICTPNFIAALFTKAKM